MLERGMRTYVELPPLNVLTRLFTRDDDDQLGDFGLLHPFRKLAHDLLDVRFHLVVDRGHHCEAILLHSVRLLVNLPGEKNSEDFG